MRFRPFILLFMLTALLVQSHVQAAVIEKTYTFRDYHIQAQGQYFLFTMPGSKQSGLAGCPRLPYFPVSLLLPPGESAVRVEFIGGDRVEVPGSFLLAPYQPAIPISATDRGPFRFQEQVYASDSAYPADPRGELMTQFLSGHSLALTSFTPVQYLPASGKIAFFRTVTIRVYTRPSEKATDALKNISHKPLVKKRLDRMAQNPELSDAYPPVTSGAEDYEVLILTSTTFLDAFQPLIDLYFERGMKTRVKLVSEVYTEMSGVDNPQKIRNFIIQEYQDHQIEFVMLGGDVEHCPYRGLYCKAYSTTIIEDNNIPSDLYFAALDGSWNDDNDGSWGEIGEEDLIPELAVGRMPASTSQELSNMINKLLAYQNVPVLSDLRSPLLAGEWLYDNPASNGSTYLKMLVGYHSDSGYTTQGIPPDHPYDTLYDQPAPNYYRWTKATLMTMINQGHSFIHHLGHANSTYNMKMNSSDITNSNFAQLNGLAHIHVPVYTEGCISGSFDNDLCIGEKMVTLENFAVAFIGNSRYGWFNEGQADGPSLHLHREFLDALYGLKEPTIGMAHSISKDSSAPFVTAPGQHEEGALRWCVYTCNLLGDPAMQVWTDEPRELAVAVDGDILLTATSLEGTVTEGSNGVAGLTAVLIQGNQMLGKALSGVDGQFSIPLGSPAPVIGPAKLVLSGYNCLPDSQQVYFYNGLSGWTGGTSNQWDDPDNWSDGRPGPETDITIHPGDHDPVVLGEVVCQSLSIEAGASLHLNPGAALTATGNTTVGQPAGLVLHSDAGGMASFIDNGNVSGSVKVEHYLTGSGGTTPDGRFHYTTLPLTSANSAVFNAAGSDRLWFWDEANQAYAEINDNTTPLVVQKGYVSRCGSNVTLDFTGTLNTGNLSASGLTRTGTTEAKRGFHLMGNPYPSSIDWVGATRQNLLPTVWFRTADAQGNMLFDTYNATLDLGTNNNGQGPVTRYIPPMQAFWVKVNADGNQGTFGVNNNIRSHQVTSGYKSVNQDDKLLRITVASDDGQDECLVYFSDFGQEGFEESDSPKLFANLEAVAEVFTLVPDEGAVVINSLPFLNEACEIPLGLKCLQAGTYTLSLDAPAFFPAVAILLEDTELNTTTDLRAGGYTFTSPPANNTSRFVLHLTPAMLTGTVKYNNPGKTPLPAVSLDFFLPSSPTAVLQATTDSSGTFRLAFRFPGTYTARASSAQPSFGINATDALVVLYHFAEIQQLSGLRLLAADVDGNGHVNAIDALLIQRRFVELINTFPAGDWIFEENTFTISGEGQSQVLNIKGLCRGDVVN